LIGAWWRATPDFARRRDAPRQCFTQQAWLAIDPTGGDLPRRPLDLPKRAPRLRCPRRGALALQPETPAVSCHTTPGRCLARPALNAKSKGGLPVLPGSVCGTPIYTAEPGKSSSPPGLFFTISLRRFENGSSRDFAERCKSFPGIGLRVVVPAPAGSRQRPCLPKSLVNLGKMNRWTVGIGGIFVATGGFGAGDPWGP
jgi:hypothetical protein